MLVDILKSLLIKFILGISYLAEMTLNMFVVYFLLTKTGSGKIVLASILCVSYLAIYLVKLQPKLKDFREQLTKFLHKVVGLHYTE